MISFEIKKNIKDKCRERNITLADLSRQTGIDYAGLIRNNNFTLRNICKIMLVLDCKFEDLFEIVEIK